MDVVDLTRQLVSIPSVNPTSQAQPTAECGEAAMAAAICDLLQTMQATNIDTWDTYPGRPSVSGYFDFGASDTLIFDTHLDTVPVAGMTVDPFAAELRDGRIYGRGSCDMKGPMAAMLCAISQVIEAGTKPRFNVLFAATADEESGFGGVKSFLARLDATRYAPLFGAVVAEPTDLKPVAAHKGTCRWIIGTAGVAAHSSTPHLGKNAIYKMAPIITALEQYAARLATHPPHARLGAPSLSVGTITGGSAVNIVPDFCQLQIDRRLVPGETPESATEELATELAQFDVTISDPMVAAPPMETSDGSPLVAAALDASRAAGEPTQVDYANYCTNAACYGPLRIPVVVYGPGSIAQAHTKDEWIATNALTAGVVAYQTLILGSSPA